MSELMLQWSPIKHFHGKGHCLAPEKPHNIETKRAILNSHIKSIWVAVAVFVLKVFESKQT